MTTGCPSQIPEIPGIFSECRAIGFFVGMEGGDREASEAFFAGGRSDCHDRPGYVDRSRLSDVNSGATVGRIFRGFAEVDGLRPTVGHRVVIELE